MNFGGNKSAYLLDSYDDWGSCVGSENSFTFDSLSMRSDVPKNAKRIQIAKQKFKKVIPRSEKYIFVCEDYFSSLLWSQGFCETKSPQNVMSDPKWHFGCEK